MSTNYYAFGPGITDPEGLHIGQAAAGWRFLFRAWPEHGLTTFAAWREFILRPDITIRNEYGRDVPADEMGTTMVERNGHDGLPLQPRFGAVRTTLPDGYSIDPDGYHAFCDREFF